MGSKTRLCTWIEANPINDYTTTTDTHPPKNKDRGEGFGWSGVETWNCTGVPVVERTDVTEGYGSTMEWNMGCETGVSHWLVQQVTTWWFVCFYQVGHPTATVFCCLVPSHYWLCRSGLGKWFHLHVYSLLLLINCWLGGILNDTDKSAGTVIHLPSRAPLL